MSPCTSYLQQCCDTAAAWPYTRRATVRTTREPCLANMRSSVIVRLDTPDFFTGLTGQVQHGITLSPPPLGSRNNIELAASHGTLSNISRLHLGNTSHRPAFIEQRYSQGIRDIAFCRFIIIISFIPVELHSSSINPHQHQPTPQTCVRNPSSQPSRSWPAPPKPPQTTSSTIARGTSISPKTVAKGP